MADGLVDRLESFLRRLLDRLGGTLDAATRKSLAGRTDPASLTPLIERAIEGALRRESGHLIAPHQIEVRFEHEIWSHLDASRRDYLHRELSDTTLEYVYNRRYHLLQPLELRVAGDPFTRGVEIRVSGGERAAAEESPATASVMIRLVESRSRRDHRSTVVGGGAEPVGIGRNATNEIVINDPTLSGFHAALMIGRDGSLELADRGSSNGTAVNGVALGVGGRAAVRDGDRLSFGDVEVTLIVVDR